MYIYVHVSYPPSGFGLVRCQCLIPSLDGYFCIRITEGGRVREWGWWEGERGRRGDGGGGGE